MSKKLKYFLIVISITSILVSLYAIVQSKNYFDSFSGIVIGVSLLGALYFDNYKKKKE